ncbi:DNA gyrase inhibitor YacG [Stenoxybacter acetivorans]|uniref:DNA gyrase inhibitor YacG n=1 Tax=Stenoxybacter acetivorans TaxID=422441 RepID=UPI00055B2300|nr:DNA gyrase inhibitor YacG [Stenoxybacter acetivorans]
MNSPTPTVICPVCGKSVQWLPENRFRPFCSERCKLIDLGAWINENYPLKAEELPAQDSSVHD